MKSEEFITDKNFLVKYLILELFEKLHRMSKYVNTCSKFDRKNNTARIVSLFNDSIDTIAKEIDKLCKLVNSELDETERLGYILSISTNTKAIMRLHEQLKHLHSSWILPEIKTFANTIIKNEDGLKEEITIILSDNYSFLESNLGKKFKDSLQNVYLKALEFEPSKENHSFILPKIEFSNPLNWTIIAHEAGHLQTSIIKELRNNPDIMPDEIETINEELIKNWAEEIYCDLYATSFIGPAYFISFITFSLLSFLDFGMASHSEKHPSVILRASIILDYLRDNDLTFKSGWGTKDYCKIFESCLVGQYSIIKDEPQKSIKATKFNMNLRKLIKELSLGNFKINETDSIRVQKLVGLLKEGIPIGSICDGNLNGTREEILKGDLYKESIDKLKNSITERSCKTWEILNAGWVYKLEHLCNDGNSIFFRNEGKKKSVKEKLDEYGALINILDERLLSSINTSQIIKIIEKNDGTF